MFTFIYYLSVVYFFMSVILVRNLASLKVCKRQSGLTVSACHQPKYSAYQRKTKKTQSPLMKTVFPAAHIKFYWISIASPKEKNRYLSFTASS